jgi:hypothetical protein
MLSHAVPEAPCTVLLELEEWPALYCALHRTPLPPPEPPSLRQAVPWIARLGGFLGRRGDGELGTTVLWKGFQQLTALATMYCIMRPAPPKRRNMGKDEPSKQGGARVLGRTSPKEFQWRVSA